MDAVSRVPNPVNEPIRQYAPGSHERAVLESRIKDLAGQRAEQHDAAAAPGAHRLSVVVHEGRRCRHVEIDDSLKLREIAVKKFVAVRVRGRDQDQQPHLEPARRRRDPGTGVGCAQIGLDGANLNAVPAALVGRLLQCGRCAGNQHQIQTRFREKSGEFSADPLRAARDQRPRPVLRGVDHRVDARRPA